MITRNYNICLIDMNAGLLRHYMYFMRSRKGIVMAILLALLSIGNLIAWPLISYYIRNGLI